MRLATRTRSRALRGVAILVPTAAVVAILGALAPRMLTLAFAVKLGIPDTVLIAAPIAAAVVLLLVSWAACAWALWTLPAPPAASVRRVSTAVAISAAMVLAALFVRERALAWALDFGSRSIATWSICGAYLAALALQLWPRARTPWVAAVCLGLAAAVLAFAWDGATDLGASAALTGAGVASLALAVHQAPGSRAERSAWWVAPGYCFAGAGILALTWS